MRALNKTWHKACFVCTYQGCGERFEGGKFYRYAASPQFRYLQHRRHPIGYRHPVQNTFFSSSDVIHSTIRFFMLLWISEIEVF
jgi:hypothetical protein